MAKHRTVVVLTGGRDVEIEPVLVAKLAHALQWLRPAVAICGACPTGVDKWGAAVIRAWGAPVIEMPALWDVQGRAAGPLRNHRMLAHGRRLSEELGLPLYVLAGPGGRGTAHCTKAAEESGVDVRRFGFDEIDVRIVRRDTGEKSKGREGDGSG